MQGVHIKTSSEQWFHLWWNMVKPENAQTLNANIEKEIVNCVTTKRVQGNIVWSRWSIFYIKGLHFRYFKD